LSFLHRSSLISRRLTAGLPGFLFGLYNIWAVRGAPTEVARRHSHVYVFALLAHTDKATVNPLDLDQWALCPTDSRIGRTHPKPTLNHLLMVKFKRATGQQGPGWSWGRRRLTQMPN